MKCDRCGNENPSEANFCTYCGERIQKNACIDAEEKSHLKIRGSVKKKRAAVFAGLSAATAVIILACVWGVSSKNRTVDILKTGALKVAENTSKSISKAGSTSNSLSKQDDPKEKIRNELSEAKAKLSSIKKEAEDIISDESVKASSSRLLEAEENARLIIFSQLQSAGYITVPEDYKDSLGIVVRDKIIDSAAGSSIEASGIKAACDAIASGKSVSEILTDSVSAAASSIPDYLVGKAEDLITERLGGADVFRVIHAVDGYINADDTPKALAAEMKQFQKRDIYRALSIAEQERLTGADILFAAGLLDRIGDRNSELIKASAKTGVSSISGRELVKCFDSWTAETGRLDLISKLRDKGALEGFETDLSLSDEKQLEQAKKLISDWDNKVGIISSQEPFKDSGAFESLKGLSLSVDYDINDMKAAEKGSNQSSAIGGGLLGDFFGSLFASSQDDSSNSVQRIRAELYEKIEEFLMDEYYSYCLASSDSLCKLNCYKNDPEVFSTLFSKLDGAADAVEKELEEYLPALERYEFALQQALTVYENTLSSTGSSCISKLKNGISSVDAVITKYDPGRSFDISDEEKDEMYLRTTKPYVDWLTMALNYSLHDPAFGLTQSVNVYDSGCEFIGNPINGTIICIRGRNINNAYGVRGEDLYFYDKRGNLMYMKTRFGEFMVRDGHMAKAECVNELNATEENFRDFIDAGTRIREDFVNGTLPQNYPSYEF